MASALLAPVCALIGLGLGAIVRHSATTIVDHRGLLMLLPVVISGRHGWTAAILRSLPHSAWYHLSAEQMAPADARVPSTGAAWLVYAVWAVAAAIVAIFAVDRRDV